MLVAARRKGVRLMTVFDRLRAAPAGRGVAVDRRRYESDVRRKKVYRLPGLSGTRTIPNDPATESRALREQVLNRLQSTMKQDQTAD
jgi:hypothetical protein